MSRKHNTQHPGRGRSKYPQRLRARGESTRSVAMADVETLRRRQERTLPEIMAAERLLLVSPTAMGKRPQGRPRNS